ncbi:hypothetical protein ACJX0J_010333 [Zea mays]
MRKKKTQAAASNYGLRDPVLAAQFNHQHLQEERAFLLSQKEIQAREVENYFFLTKMELKMIFLQLGHFRQYPNLFNVNYGYLICLLLELKIIIIVWIYDYGVIITHLMVYIYNTKNRYFELFYQDHYKKYSRFFSKPTGLKISLCMLDEGEIWDLY